MTQRTSISEFRGVLTGSMRDEVAKQLPKGIDPDRFIRTAITVVQMNPDLLEANRTSLFGAVMMAAKDGLLPDGREATIQVYNTKMKVGGREEWVKIAQYMPMVGGLLMKMYEAGCTYVDAAAVYEKDHFRFSRGDNPGLEHEPDILSDDPGKVIAAYAIVKLANGEVKREVMPRRDIEKVRGASKAGNGPGWTTWYDQFAIKSVIKRIYKQLPNVSEDLQRLIDHDNEAMGFGSLDVMISKPANDAGKATPEAMPDKSKRSSRLDSIIKANGIGGSSNNEPEPVADQEEEQEPSQQEVQF